MADASPPRSRQDPILPKHALRGAWKANVFLFRISITRQAQLLPGRHPGRPKMAPRLRNRALETPTSFEHLSNTVDVCLLAFLRPRRS
eukprot:7389991-Pyramimonas_sp.AAC.1